MIKNSITIILALVSLYSFGQNIKFQPNINHKAKVLKQGLNNSGDSLILESSKKPIRQVDIFNEDFLESIDVNKNKAQIDLNILPAGNFIVQARVGRKRIVMYLRKQESQVIAYSEQEKLDEQNSDMSSELEPLDNSQKKKSKNKKNKRVIYYWAVQESNSNFGSTKIMKLIYKNEIESLVEKNKLELQSDIGKDNTLVIYAIYDKNKFMRKQQRNPKYYKTAKKSKLFNVVPYYSSFNEIDTVPNS